MRSTLGCIIALLIWLSSIALVVVILIGLSFWTDRSLDFWCTYFSHHTVDVPFWMSALLSFIGNGAVFVLNLVSEIVRVCMGA